MSGWFDDQAEVSDNDDEDVPKSKRARINSDDEEDEEEDETEIAKEMQGFVVTGDDDEEELEANDEEKKSDSEEEQEELEEDDEDLIHENLGISVKKPKRRIQVGDSDSDEEHNKDHLEHQLFDRNEETEKRSSAQRPRHIEVIDDDERGSESGDESGMEDFIEEDDDATGPRQRRKKGRQKMPISDSALQEAREIFGDALDLGDLYPDEYEEEEEVEEGDIDEYEDEEGERTTEVRRTKKVTKKKGVKKSLLEQLEPSELDRGYLSEFDKKIQLEDKPERFQLRGLPVCEADSDELLAESNWIYTQAFCTIPVSHQEEPEPKSKNTPDKIKEALTFIRNQDFEVPFIAFYRKEYVDPELNISDLWKIYHWDEKWCQLQSRKKNVTQLFERMQRFQTELIFQDPARPLTDDIRPLTNADIEKIYHVQTPEELQDVYLYFLLYYGRDIPKMIEWERYKEIQEKGENGEVPQAWKQASRRDKYSICVDAGLCGLANKFGLTPKQFAENFEYMYAKNQVDQCPLDPQEAAQEFVSEQFATPEDTLKGAQYVVAMQLSREPIVRRTVRERYREQAVICVRPTKKGLKEIDENNPIYSKRYLKNKCIRDIEKDEYLKLCQAESLGLITIKMGIDHFDDKSKQTYLEQILSKQIYHLDEYNERAQEWNAWRNNALTECMDKILYPHFEKETKAKLAQEAKEFVIKESALALYSWLRVGTYSIVQQSEEDEENSNKLRIMGVAYTKEFGQASFAAIIDGEGEVTDHLRLVHLTKRKDSFKNEERRLKEQDLETLRNFLATKRPHVIALAAESLEALMIKSDIESVINELEQDGQITRPIPVEYIDTELAKVYMNSKKAQADYPDYPILLRQAISLARRLQDPLVEFCQLCTPDEEILCLKYHPLQDMVNKEELLNCLMLEFINRVNEVGVDINRCLEHPHTASMLQFVCGLGPRKATHLLKVLHQNDNMLENRTKLVTVCHMGPKVFMNCAGFIKIDTLKIAEKTDDYVEVLDGSRVHPETYEWARKMAVDALEYDDTTEDANPASALEEILETPERLKDLDLDAFAEELQRQGFGNKNITLYDIRAELNCRYKDLRVPYEGDKKEGFREELFNMLTKETPTTFNEGKLVVGRVMGIVYRKPQLDQLEHTNPTRNDETGLWICPLCLKNDFSELSEVWSHFDMKMCPGQAIGVRVRLENGVSGFIPTKYISDKRVENPADRVKVGMPIYCRIMKVDTNRFSAELSCRSSDLRDDEGRFKPRKDHYHDSIAELEDIKKEKNLQNLKQKQQYVKRVIAHPCFHNVSFKDAERMLSRTDQGEVVIRPSSKGHDHLTVTWKVADGIYQHVDVREEAKENAFSLGRTLYIGDEVFEDLDEIIARYVQPMAANARELLNFKYYKDSEGGNRELVENYLLEEKQKAPNRIVYCFSASKEFIGKFMLSYLPKNKARHEFVTVLPNGFRFRGIIHRTLNQLLAWFKEHFRDPIPGMTPATGTPADQASFHGITPRFDTMSRATPGQVTRTPGAWPTAQAAGFMGQPMPFATPGQPMYAVPQVAAGHGLLPPPQFPTTTPHQGGWPQPMDHQFTVPQPRDQTSTRRGGRGGAGAEWADSARNWNQRRDNSSYYGGNQQDQYYGSGSGGGGGGGGGGYHGSRGGGGGYSGRGRGGRGRGGRGGDSGSGRNRY